MTDNEHPAWLAVGENVQEVRRLGRSVSWRRPVTVVRHTATSVFVAGSSPSSKQDRYTAKGRGRYELTPRYLDYSTTLEPLDSRKASDD